MTKNQELAKLKLHIAKQDLDLLIQSKKHIWVVMNTAKKAKTLIDNLINAIDCLSEYGKDIWSENEYYNEGIDNLVDYISDMNYNYNAEVYQEGINENGKEEGDDTVLDIYLLINDLQKELMEIDFKKDLRGVTDIFSKVKGVY